MYTKIMVPVDMAHLDQLEKALATAADMSKLYASPVVYVGVTAALPTEMAHNPDEFAAKLEDLANQQAEKYGLESVATAPYIIHDPAADLDETLLKAIREIGADLVVMASHVPGMIEHVRASNGGYVASHSKVSVFVIR